MFENLEEMKVYINKIRSTLEFMLDCLCCSCDFQGSNVEALMEYLATRHELLMKKLIKA